MIKKKLTKILGLALLSATVMTGANTVIANASTVDSSQDKVKVEETATTDSSESKAEDKSEVKAENKTDAKNENKAETKVENKEDSKTTNKTESKSETKPEDKEVQQDGWVKDDNGNMYFYENGKKVTGMYFDCPGVIYYFDANGVSAKGWTEIDGKMYYFEKYLLGGYKMATCKVIDGKYLGEDGSVLCDAKDLHDGWTKSDDGNWSYYEHGEKVKGKCYISPDNFYYFDKDGVSAKGWTEIDGKMYYFKERANGGYELAFCQIIDGKYVGGYGYEEPMENYKANGWVKSEDGNWSYYQDGNKTTGKYMINPSTTYYFDKDGVSAKGWTEIDGKMYYFKEIPSGGYQMATSEHIDGYYVDENGVRHDSSDEIKKGWVSSEDGNWRYYNEDGVMQTGLYSLSPSLTFYFDKETGASLSGWQTIDGKEYYFKPFRRGFVMARGEIVDGFYVDKNGVKDCAVGPDVKHIGWVETDGKSYYYNKQGKVLTGLQTLDDGKTYLFDEKTGASIGGWQEVNGKMYFFDNSRPMGYGYECTKILEKEEFEELVRNANKPR